MTYLLNGLRVLDFGFIKKGLLLREEPVNGNGGAWRQRGQVDVHERAVLAAQLQLVFLLRKLSMVHLMFTNKK